MNKDKVPWNKGIPCAEETKRKIGLANKGNIPWSKGKTGVYSKKALLKMRLAKLGMKLSEEHKKKISENNKGEKNPFWKGGRYISSYGYVLIWKKDHPNADNRGYVSEHALVATKALGRPLKKGEVVHHINGNKAENKNKNLLICVDGYHKWLEHKMSNLYKKEHFGDICC